MNKGLIDRNGCIVINNINEQLIDGIVRKIKSSNHGQCVCRQFDIGKKYTMLITDILSKPLETNKIELTFALWVDESDASHYITRTIPFYITDTTRHIWETFCEKVSGGKARWEQDLLGNFFIGHISYSKVKTQDGVFSYENIVVDEFLDRLDPDKVLCRKNEPVKTNPKGLSMHEIELLDAD